MMMNGEWFKTQSALDYKAIIDFSYKKYPFLITYKFGQLSVLSIVLNLHFIIDIFTHFSLV